MTGSYELQHADGTTTVVEVDDSGNYYVYTTDSSTGERIDNGPSSEIGSNYTLEEVLDSYRREDDVPSDATPEEIADPTTTGPDPATTEPGGTDSSETEPGVMDPSGMDLDHDGEPSGVESDSEEPGSTGGG
ncbi:hypothetical protein AWB81_07104 [Caballeronia arationis]|uniref:hypothetical protein n=1 Tax=Caballeronia arationis TaxID=1777142 RepID=UPI00074D0E0E|nr:hypothetical protein [Caballeronia arationis]SAL05305.1 hypothetical protein AWB81_07104 [Caballeronia arationis]